MIRFGDALLLASTKLRTRKVRTIVTAVMASLMFATIVFAFTLLRGAMDSYQNFSANSLSDRYIVNVYHMDAFRDIDHSSPGLIVQAKAKHQQRITAKVEEARRLGIEYDPAQEMPVTEREVDTGEEFLNTQHVSVRELFREQSAKEPSVLERTAELARGYSPVAQYSMRPLGDTANLTHMKNGRETLLTANAGNSDIVSSQDVSGPSTAGYLPLAIVEPYMLQGADRSPANSLSDNIPVIVPYSHAESALGLTPLSRTATNEERVQRLDEVKQRAAGSLIEVCYRNESSRQLIETARQQIRDRERSGNSADYQAPQVQYALPNDTDCGPVTIATDARSAAEREYDQKLQDFSVKFKDEFAPIERKITFRIVGISPDALGWETMTTAESLLLAIGGSSLRGEWVVPEELVDASVQQALLPASNENTWAGGLSNGGLVEFATADDVKRFVADNRCLEDGCKTAQDVQYFGSNSVLIDDITNRTVAVMKWVVLVVAAIAALLMAGMAGRVITDSRRETAVFRAIGARRGDIRLIYVLYIVMFALIVSAVAIGLGLLAAWGINVWQSETLTTTARLMFIESEFAGRYRVVGMWPSALAVVVGIILVTGLISIILPLARNLVRSPLRDMRDE